MKDTHYRVYCWMNTVTGKKYVGYTGDGIAFRWSKHLLGAASGMDTYFYRSIRKYGPDVWVCNELFASTDKKEAMETEKRFINEFNTLAPNGYNSATGGTGGNTFNGVRVEERRKILSAATSGEKNPRYSGFTDAEIIDRAVGIYLKNGKWNQSEWKKVVNESGIPKYFTQFRFKEHGGGAEGFRKALKQKLVDMGIENPELDYYPTDDHKNRISMANSGKIWITELSTGKSRKIFEEKFDKTLHVKGRKINDKN